MKKIFIALLLITSFFISCESPGDDTVGSTKDTPINGLSFTIDTVYLENTPKLVAKGRVKNLSTTKVLVPWYVEGQFYSDSTYTLKLGGSYSQIGVPLETGQETLWTINFASNNVDVRSYPKAKIADIRGIYKK